MRLLMIRHGEPDYSIDSLTKKGWREAELLADRISRMKIDAFYMSPLGRARDTASVTLKKMGRTAEILPWLREFDAPVIWEDGRKTIPWDLLPEVWVNEPRYFDRERWKEVPLMARTQVGREADWVGDSLDRVLEKHGYCREGNYYRVLSPNEDTIAFFCHFGVQCVMLGHLLGISPLILWHEFCAAPSAVTSLVTEERRKGIALFRMGSFGDISHLYAGGEEPSFAARFCETYDNTEERHM